MISPPFGFLRKAAGGGGGSTLLVGANTVRSFSGNALNDGYAIYYVFTAVASGIGTKGYARVQGSFGDANGKFVVWNGTTGAVLQVSSVAVIPEAGGLVEFALSGVSIDSGTQYKLGYVADGHTDVAASADAWALGYESNSYASPGTVSGTGGDVNGGVPEIYLVTT